MIRKQSNNQVNQLKKKHIKLHKDDVIYETPMRSSKLRKCKDGRGVGVERKPMKDTIDFNDETPYPRVNNRSKATSNVVHETPYLKYKIKCQESGQC